MVITVGSIVNSVDLTSLNNPEIIFAVNSTGAIFSPAISIFSKEIFRFIDVTTASGSVTCFILAAQPVMYLSKVLL